jgi:hypothetical protein
LGSRYIALLALYLNKREVYPGDGVSLNFKQQRLDVPALSARRWIGLLCNSSFSASAPTMIQEIEFARDSPLEGGVRCELVSAAGPSPPIKGSFIAGLMNS